MSTDVDPTTITIPADLLPADGRFGCGPSKVRVEQVDALRGAATSILGTSHRQTTVRSQVGRVRSGLADAVRAARRLRGDPRQRRVHGVLGRRHVRPHRGPRAVPDVRRVRLEVRRGRARRPRTSARPTVHHVRPRQRPAVRRRGRASTCTDPRTTRPPPAWRSPPPASPAPTRARSWPSTPPRRPAAWPWTPRSSTSTTSRPQKCFASDGGLWFALLSPAAVERIESVAASGRWMPGLPGPEDRAGQLAPGADLQHPGPGHDPDDGRAGRLVQRPGRHGLDDGAHRAVGRQPLRLGRGERRTPRPT